MLSNMFDPTTETATGWDLEVRDDVIEEGNKHGGFLHIVVDKASPIFFGKARNLAHCSPLKSIKVFIGKVGLEEAEEEGRLVGNLVEHNRQACPGRL